jgi:hypothetical protein
MTTMTDLTDAPSLESLAPNWPLLLFTRLELAVERGDHSAAAEAQQLLLLGVRVEYGRPPADRLGVLR